MNTSMRAGKGWILLTLIFTCWHGINAQTWYETADERIDTLRKGEFILQLTDSLGNPYSDSIHIRLSKHEFQWGNIVDRLDNSALSKWKQAVLLKYYNYGVVERFKWPYMEGVKGRVNYTDVDSIYAWAKRVGWDIRAHTLLWGGSDNWEMPGWTLTMQGKPLYDACETRVRRDVSYYKDVIREYDVMNEPIHETWLATNAGDSVNWNSFKWARETDPDARLFVNDYNIIVWGSATDYINKIKQMQSHGAPIDGIGVQGHMEGNINWSDVKSKLDQVATLGLPIKVTEFDMKIKEQGISEQNMASGYGIMMRTCFSHPAVEGLLWWGFLEPTWREGSGLFTATRREKIAADTVYHLIHEVWTTDVYVKPEADGTVQFQGFYGDYSVGVKEGDEYRYVYASCKKADEGDTIQVNAKHPAPASPVLQTAYHSFDGSKVYLQFDREMEEPVSALNSLLIYGSAEVPVTSATVNAMHKNLIELDLGAGIKFNSNYCVVYTPGDLKSKNGGVLPVTGPETIVNHIPGLIYAQTNTSGDSVELSLSHPMNDPAASLDDFVITVNSAEVTTTAITYKSGSDSILVIALASPVSLASDVIKVSYTRGTLSSVDSFLLENFSQKGVKNNLPTGMNEPRLASVHAYPNPFTERLIVEFPAETAADAVRLTDLTGRELNAFPVYGTHAVSFDASMLGKGMYLIQVKRGGEIVGVGKVVKE